MEKKNYGLVFIWCAVGLLFGAQRTSTCAAIEEEQTILALIVSAWKKPGTKASFTHYEEARRRLLDAADVLGSRQLRSLQNELLDTYEMLLAQSPHKKEDA